MDTEERRKNQHGFVPALLWALLIAAVIVAIIFVVDGFSAAQESRR